MNPFIVKYPVMNESVLRNKIPNLPSGPGIYLFRGLKNKPLYIGKALKLKNRVKHYLKTDDTRIQKMISESKKLDCIETKSEIEALILESQLIKKHKPLFNIMIRDDKQYSFVVFGDEKYQKIFTTHQPQSYKETIGPFTDAGALKTTLRLLRKILPYCTCKQLHNNYCLNYHIEKCLGFCCSRFALRETQLANRGSSISQPNSKIIWEKSGLKNQEMKFYQTNIKAIRDILSGKKVSLIKNLKKEMGQFAQKGELEKAIELRNKIKDVEQIFKNAKIIKNSDILKTYRSGLESLLGLKKLIIRIEGYDISNIQGVHATGSMVTFINGIPDKNFYRKFKIHAKQSPDDTAMLKEVLERRFRHSEWPFPDLIIVDGGKGQLNAARSTLATFNISIPIIGISKNEHHVGHQLITSGRKNPLSLTKLSPTDKNLLLQIDSEAHRFAIGYYRKLHRKLYR